MMVYDAERLPEALYRNICELGFNGLTDVQKAVVEADAVAFDLFVVAPTGSGKTIGFGLAIAAMLGGADISKEPPVCRAAVILPTRELASQVTRVFERLYLGTGIRVLECGGGVPIEVQSGLLEAGCDIIVATPGRLRKQIQRGSVRLEECRSLVIDEADELLSGDFRADLDPVLLATGTGNQRCRVHLFSATCTPELGSFSQLHQRDPLKIEIQEGAHRLPKIDLQGVIVPPVERDLVIARLLRQFHPARSLVFCRRREDAVRLCAKLHRHGFAVVSLTGSLLPHERVQATESLSQGLARVCVATDLAARGLDIEGLDVVIHAGPPENANTMLHRSGRAGRGGSRGRAILVLTKPEQRRAERLADQIGRSIDWIAPPRAVTTRQADLERIGQHPAFGEDQKDIDRTLADHLRRRFSSDVISVACARLWRESRPPAKGPQGDDLLPATRKSAPATRVWLEMEIGALTRFQMAEILKLICATGRIDRFEVGRIHVGTGFARFEVAQTIAERVLSAPAASEGPRIRLPSDGS